ncbi:hypothetical protein X564_20310 [Pseudoalteromonas agarivorans]|nr:hypothetical protein X564_20310 [Pseudoalteromonas agarivorans]
MSFFIIYSVVSLSVINNKSPQAGFYKVKINKRGY